MDTLERVIARCVVIETSAEDPVVDFKRSQGQARIVVLSIEIRDSHPKNGPS